MALPVVLVSLDGVAPRFVTPQRMPNLCAVARAGSGCFTARTVEPPWTRPVHASMLRGVDPATHGLADNSMAPLVTAAPSILALASAAGLVTASAHNWRQLEPLIEPGASRHRVFVDAGYDPAEDDLIVDHVTAIFGHGPPHVTFVYLCRADLAGHDHGWGSPEYLDALVRLDACLGRLLAAVGDDTQVVVTTDHGGVGTNHGTVERDVMEIFVAARSPRLPPGSMWTAASVLDVASTVADLAGLDPDPHWQGASLVGREQPLVDHLVGLLQDGHRHTYGEGVTMLQHALQTAADLQRTDGADEALVLAGVLHDVGHVLGEAGEWGDPDHADEAARWLGPWLPPEIVEPIRLHVAAKRHLVGVDAEYARALSHASRVTLAQQGGPFDAHASAEFAALPHADRAIRLRIADDAGKRSDTPTPTLESFRPRLAAALGLRS